MIEKTSKFEKYLSTGRMFDIYILQELLDISCFSIRKLQNENLYN